MARNKFGGTCYKCNAYVPPGFGHFEYFNGHGRKWRIQCVKCASGRTVKKTDKEVVKILEERKKHGF